MRYLIIALIMIGTIRSVTAQELSPRAYWPGPKGTKVGVLGYSYSFGDIITDPSLPVAGVDSKINTVLMAYTQLLSLWGRTTNVLVELPYSWGTTKRTAEDAARRDVSGINDISITLSVNLFGAPSMTPEEFQKLRKNPHTILGASLKVLAPTSAYEADKLINVGTNRWAFKTELGYMIPLENRWLLEFELGTWFFTDNDDFLGMTRKQKPVLAAEIHLVRRFKPGFWAALDFNYFTGGRTTVNDEIYTDLQRNSRIGGTIVYPFAGRHALKAGFSMSMVTGSDGNYKSLILGYQLLLN